MIFKSCRNGKPLFQNLSISFCNCCVEQDSRNDPDTMYQVPVTPTTPHKQSIDPPPYEDKRPISVTVQTLRKNGKKKG